MQHTEKRWIIKENPPVDTVAKLIEDVGVSRPVATILAQRDINTFEQAKAFFRPTIEELHDPFLMKGMHAAVDRIEQAIARNENILVYGYYDVDGTTAVALMYSFLTQDY